MAPRTLPAGPLKQFIAQKMRRHSVDEMAKLSDVSEKRIYRLMAEPDDALVTFFVADQLVTSLGGVLCVEYGDAAYEAWTTVQTKS